MLLRVFNESTNTQDDVATSSSFTQLVYELYVSS